MHDRTAAAARNNALWCDAVCRAHGKPGEFHSAIWLNRHGTPPFYPDAVTLEPGDALGQVDRIADLIGQNGDRGFAVKDSFCALDLSPSGFKTLFEARWLFRDPLFAKDATKNSLSIVKSEEELAAWEKAWAGPDSHLLLRLFDPLLLREPDIAFAFSVRDGVMMSGGILNRGAGVVGLSNIFAPPSENEGIRLELARLAAHVFPGCPLVGYERGEDLIASCGAGLTPIGDLRVWVRPAS
ncbi:hypothetical protein [Microvirga terricola]|uniref:Uncharacterized protein n=1 Tax=Microvirga terricola TaxID=2719797 RepID=A0ABX0V7H5_9HYPH|nr:hypothetical protein [Microvirga terricola]NIX75528.1 hypothetical protein [Microvirga terricola]